MTTDGIGVKRNVSERRLSQKAKSYPKVPKKCN